MSKVKTLALVASIVAGAAIAWRLADSNRHPADRIPAADGGQAAIERILDQTFRESRTGVESPPVISPPETFPAPENVAAQPQTATDDLGTRPALAPEGYTLGTWHGFMQRAPSSGDAVSTPLQNPAWLDPAAAHAALLDQATRASRDFTFAVLRLGPRTNLAELGRALAALDARIEGVSGEFARVRVPAERLRLESIAGLTGVLGLGALPPDQKVPEAFVQEMRSRAAGELVPVYITLMSADSTGEWRQALSSLGIMVGAWDSDLRSYTANMPAAALAQAMAADYVMAIEPVPVVTANHASSVPVMGVDGLRQYVPAEGRFTGLTGEGIAVGVLDTGLNTRHVDIAHGRESVCGVNFVADEHWDLWLDMQGHGTHVFGTLAGAGRSDPLLAGVAPGLSHLRFGKVLSAEGFGSGEDIRRAMDHFSRATSCAWRGAALDAIKPLIVNMSLSATALNFSGRGVGERKLDAVVHAHSQLYVVAQSNAGLHGFSNFGTAKNSLAVGAVEDSGLIARFSSHGPTADGRLAPNLVGTGVGLTSARGQGSLSAHYTASGTSMASPSVAGVAALLMQARPEFRNRPALTRARLMASAIRPNAYFDRRGQLPADNSGGPGTFNNLYGLGLVSGRTAVLSNDSPGGWLNGSASAAPTDGVYEYIDIDVPEGASRLDVVLTWDEQPADTLTRSVLNNLDLWADRGADCGADACGEHASRSKVDNVEWLLIADPSPGVYRIKAVPVEIYGESVSAAVAWTIRRGEATPRLDLQVEETSSPNADSRYLAVDVTVESSGYVASGTTIHIGCRIAGESECSSLLRAFLPNRSRVFRGDGQSRPLQYSYDALSIPISVGEVAAGSPRRVQLWFLREELPPGATLYVTASSWNALAAVRSIELAGDSASTGEESAAPANDSFSAFERLSGGTGATRLDLALASREPGEPLVSAGSRTLWYEWEAPAKGLFRFRVREADSGKPATVDFSLFTGDTLADLEPVAEKRGSEISFDATADAGVRLRIASGTRNSRDDWDLPLLTLEWEPADIRPANDDFDFADAIKGESGSVSSTNEGATLERSEFWGGLAASVWYEWTAPADGFAEFTLEAGELSIMAFRGSEIGALRLGAEPAWTWRSGTGGRTVFAVRSGETWRIALASEDADASGQPFTLSWEIRDGDPLAQYRNSDFFADAIPIGGAEGRARNLLTNEDGARYMYTVEASEPPETGIATGWWQWTAPGDGRFTWRMDGSTAYQLTIFTGDALDNLQLVGTLRGGSALVIDAAANTRYRIAVGRSPAEVGTASVRPGAFGWGMTPANDDRADAAPITGGTGSAEASLVHASGEANEPRSAVGLDSVWWNWRAPAAGWYRFTVEGNPLHAIVQIFPGGNSGAASSQVIGDSERSFLANGRVDVHVLVREGERFDIRLSRRPGVRLTGSDRLVWAPSAMPAYLSYKGAVTEESLIANPVFDGSWSPRHLAMTDDGMYLFSTAKGQLLGFVRDGDSGELALAYRASADSNRETLDPSRLRPDSHALWWSPVNETLFALTLCGAPYSFALPDAGTTLDVRRTERIDFPGSPSCRFLAAQGDHGGSHLYTTDDSRQRLQVFRADSATTLTHVQTISAVAATGENRTVVPNLISPVDLALASDGRHLYLVDEFGLFVFSRDPSSGRLAPAGGIPLTNDPEGPFYEMRSLRHATVDADGAVLFVTGSHSENSVTDTAVAAFDISADPANPAHLDTLTGFYFHEADRGTLNAWNHLQVRPNAFSRCDKPLAHGGLLAIDVFCTEGYFVVRWNPEASALEVTDFAFSGDRDRFGNLVPFLGYWDRRMAQSPDGAHAYRTTHWQDQGQSSAIHIFERASAMSTDDETAPPTDSVTDSSPIFAAGSGPGDQFYTIGTAIGALALPTASGGDGPLTYSLAPAVPGLNFNATATVRRLTGTPTATGTYDMTYRVRDTDGDTDTLTFTITVKAGGGDHGDDRASATGVESESDTEGVLESGDVDYFRIVVDASGTLEVYTSGRIDTRGWLEDTDGAVLGTNDDGGAGTNFRMSEDVSAGTYFVRVEGYSSGVTGGYTLHVRFTESDSGAGTDDRAALMALYDATDGSNWAIDSNWGSDSPLNSWHGVTADNSGRVTMIDLSSNQLSGSIPAELGDISNLEELWLYNNELSGPIPGELGDLSSLRLLILSLNQLSGSIPTGLGNLSNLELLSLNANKLSGPVPAELNGLSSLEELDLSSNQLSGSIPAELGDLPNLEELWLYSNELSGPIPGELGSLSDLRIMSLSLNRLSGSIPAGLGNLSNLELLSLNANKLSGPIPAELSGLSNLEDLDLSSNQLSGSIPAELGDLSGLEALWLYGNELSGSIPGELGGLSDLQIMSLSLNRLSGSIPAGLGNLSNLELLSLSDNELSGSIPTELSGLSSLEHLDLSSNQLSGSIPAELGDLSNLEALWLYGNELSGSIPAALSDLSSLEFLYLGGNQLSGCIPDRLRAVAGNDLSTLGLSYCGDSGTPGDG